MTPVFVQIKYFLNTIAIGLVMGMVFDFYRAVRGLVQPRKWTTGLSDIFVCVLLTCLAFLLLLFSNWGEVRVYVFLGFAIGLTIYFKYCSDLIITFWYNWFAFIIRSLKLFIKALIFPVILLKRVLVFVLGLISIPLYKVYELLAPIIRKLRRLIGRVTRKIIFWRKPPP